jgi:DNA modification methylase
VVVDPFGGVALGAMDAMDLGYVWLGCELEAEFVRLGRENLAKWQPFFPTADAMLVQGDSRKLREHLRLPLKLYARIAAAAMPSSDVAAVVSSPPYSDSINAQGHGIDWEKAGPATGNRKRGEGTKHEETLRAQLAYGEAPGQLGAMHDDGVDAVVSSPPYSDCMRSERNGIDLSKAYRQPGRHGDHADPRSYGDTDGQVGAMPDGGGVDAVITSPPFAHQQTGGGIAVTGIPARPGVGGASGNAGYVGQGHDPGQLADMAEGTVDAIISSPPYAETLRGDGTQRETAQESRDKRSDYNAGGSLGQSVRTQGYGGPGNLGNLSAGTVDAVVSSPPFQDQFPAHDSQENYSGFQHVGSVRNRDTGYKYAGNSPGQLSLCASGSVDAVVSSPPFGDNDTRPTALGTGKPTRADGDGAGRNKGDYVYGETDGQLGTLPMGQAEAVVSSPPFLGAHGGATDRGSLRPPNDTTDRVRSGYGDSIGQLSSMPEGVANAVVTSPPFVDARQNTTASVKGGTPTAHDPEAMGQSDGNLHSMREGNEAGETFWQAAKTIVQECFALLRPGGLAAWVVKSFVRDGKIVDFPGDWRKLCEAVGFETLEEIHASFVKRDEHPGLFGEPVVKSKKRASFFRRLHEAKHPELAIDFEVVWIMRKP